MLHKPCDILARNIWMAYTCFKRPFPPTQCKHLYNWICHFIFGMWRQKCSKCRLLMEGPSSSFGVAIWLIGFLNGKCAMGFLGWHNLNIMEEENITMVEMSILGIQTQDWAPNPCSSWPKTQSFLKFVFGFNEGHKNGILRNSYLKCLFIVLPLQILLITFNILLFTWYIPMLDRYICECIGINNQHY